MIDYQYETEFVLQDELRYTHWLKRVAQSLGADIEEVTYIFCNDAYLHKLNLEYLKHDTLTDILTFDRSVDRQLAGDIFISVDRVRDNAAAYDQVFIGELQRVMVHGLLHMTGQDDTTDTDKDAMRLIENEKIKMFHVEQG